MSQDDLDLDTKHINNNMYINNDLDLGTSCLNNIMDTSNINYSSENGKSASDVENNLSNNSMISNHIKHNMIQEYYT